MAAAASRAARVSVEYSQYWVSAGADLEAGQEVVPGLLTSLGPHGVAVFTGLQSGRLRVSAGVLTGPPGEVEPGWDVVAETDLDCPEGTISVLDWGGPSHDELGELAAAGPGHYRVRVHARNRQQVSQRQSAEEHLLLTWPAAEPAEARLLTPMDAYGRQVNGEPDQAAATPPLSAIERAAARVVPAMAALINQPAPPEYSGDMTTIAARTVAPGTARRVWSIISNPWGWVGIGGIPNPDDFEIDINDDPKMHAEGSFTVSEPCSRLDFSWSWTTRHLIETGPGRDIDVVRSWKLPPRPSTVSISLRPAGKGATLVELEHHGLPIEVAALVQPFWDWAMQELHRRITKAPFHGYPWFRPDRDDPERAAAH
jgi:hypothetical protein